MKLRYVVANGGPALMLAEPALATMTQFQQTAERDKEQVASCSRYLREATR